MFNYKNNKQKKNINLNKGFSLVEVLIAIAIIAIVIIPLAMNFISGARMNSKAKKVSASADLSTSIIEMMQTIDLSSIMTEVNGYDNDSYGSVINSTLTNMLTKKYTIGNKTETIAKTDGKYYPVIKQDGNGDNKVFVKDKDTTSSIRIRQVNKENGGILKTYFAGQPDDKYSFVISDVKNDEINVDILATIEPQQYFNIVNIASMSHSEVVYAKQTALQDKEVADEFALSNSMQIALKGSISNIEKKNADWFFNNMKRTIKVSLKKDTFSDAVTILMDAIYTIDGNYVAEKDNTIIRNLGSFTTNSTAEFSRGVYLYYFPLFGGTSNSSTRDSFIIENKDEFSVPVYFIAMNSDNKEMTEDILDTKNYKANISIKEISPNNNTKTIVCSNIPDSKWVQKDMYPAGKKCVIKSLGNNSDQQTLYAVNLKIYNHKNDSFDENNIFTPREKDLLAETNGTFIDTSERLDISSYESGAEYTPGDAIVNISKNLVYNGERQLGVIGTKVSFTGVTSAIDAGVYTFKAIPITGACWSDGTTEEKTFTWTINRAPLATAEINTPVYCKKEVIGVVFKYATANGTWKAIEANNYSVVITPDNNHSWKDSETGTYEPRTFTWSIAPKELSIKWPTGKNKDLWVYDGENHSIKPTLGNIIDGDTCSVILKDNIIKDVGIKLAKIINLSNKNYKLPQNNSVITHQIEVTYAEIATYELSVNKENNYSLMYNGSVQDIVINSKGIRFSGTRTAQYATNPENPYRVILELLDGYAWRDGSRDPKEISWNILPKPVELEWGKTRWVFDGYVHHTTCNVTNAYKDDMVIVMLDDNNIIKDAGQKITTVASLSNPNYTLGDNFSATLIVDKAPLSCYETFYFDYDGDEHTGVIGSCIDMNGTYRNRDVHTENNIVVPYKVKIKPSKNYLWSEDVLSPDGQSIGNTDAEITVEWNINPKQEAWYEAYSIFYTGKEEEGVYLVNTDVVEGIIKATNRNKYYAILKPKKNYVWRDYRAANNQLSTEPRRVEWEIVLHDISIPQLIDYEYVYDKKDFYPPILLTSVDGILEYSYDNVNWSQDIKPQVNAGTYTFYMRLVDRENTKWWNSKTNNYDTQTEKIQFTIKPKPITVNNNNNTFTYDAKYHNGTTYVTNLCPGDTCGLTYSNNSYRNAGTYTFSITGTTNPNYTAVQGYNGASPIYLTKQMTINQRGVDVNWGPLEVWGTSGSVNIVSLSNIVDSTNEIYATASGNVRNGVGEQQCFATLGGSQAGNYYIKSGQTVTLYVYDICSYAMINRIYNGYLQCGCNIYGLTMTGNHSAVNAGTYTAYFEPIQYYYWDRNKTTGKRSGVWNMLKADISKPSKVNVNYNTKKQKLATGGASGVKYKLSGQSGYSTTVPMATEAGNYTVWYTYAGDANHNDFNGSFVSTINQIALPSKYKPTLITKKEFDPRLAASDVNLQQFIEEPSESVGQITYTVISYNGSRPVKTICTNASYSSLRNYKVEFYNDVSVYKYSISWTVNNNNYTKSSCTGTAMCSGVLKGYGN